MQSASDLDAGLLIGTEHELVRPERSALPLAGVQVEHRSGPLQKVWITRSDPGSIPPGTQGVVRQHAPDGRPRGRDVAAWEAVGDFDGQFTQAVATQRHLVIGGTFAGQGHHQRTRRGCERFRSTTARSILQSSTALSGEPTQPAADGGSAHPLLARQRPTAQPSSAPQDQARAACQTLWRGASAHPAGQLVLFIGGQFNAGDRFGHAHLRARP